MSMDLEWMIGTNDQWCSLKSIDLDSYCFGNNLSGVFIVWYGPENGEPGRVVCVDHGVIKIKLGKLLDEPQLARYYKHDLLVTWAEVDHAHEVGVTAYLVAKLHPILGEKRTNSIQTLVNLPAW